MSTDEPRDPAHTSDEEWSEIVAYVTGRATAEGSQRVEARQVWDAGYREQVSRARAAWERSWRALPAAVTSEELERGWARMAASLAAESDVLPLRRRRAAAPSRWRRLALAASVVLAVGSGATWLALRGGAESSFVEAVAGRGERTQVALPDGSRVVLSPGSRLRTPERFSRDERLVVLSGQAYFNVTPDRARPFRIRTDAADVEVLGTEFDLRVLPGSARARLVVRSGRVSIRAAAAESAAATVVTSGQQASVDSLGGVTIQSGVNVDALLAWTAGRLEFDRTPLVEVLRDLERWHPVQLTVTDDALLERRVTASFEPDSLDLILQTLAELVDAQLERDGERAVLRPRERRP